MQIAQARAARSSGGFQSNGGSPGKGAGLCELLAGLNWWQSALTAVGGVLAAGGAIGLKVAFSWKIVAASALAFSGGLLLCALALSSTDSTGAGLGGNDG